MTDLQTIWHDVHGNPIGCNEKRVVLQESLQEVEVYCRNALDEALLMGCSEASAKTAFHAMIDNLTPRVKERI
ncbi:MAG: hypothetical protein MK052_03755 [Alphaproteobacteria bacterium]|nr:hypothetical protein [Alphaproteobacteria bacterium]